jgi:hypothetical protein
MLSIEGSKRYKKWLSAFKGKPQQPPAQSVEKDATTAASFVAKIKGVDIHYCVIYWSLDDDGHATLDHFALLPPVPVEDGVNGEIRPVVLTFEDYKELLRTHKKEIEPLDDQLSRAIDSKNIKIKVFIYDDENEKKYMKEINNKRLTVVCLCLTYFLLTDSMRSWYPKKMMDTTTTSYQQPHRILAQKLYPLSVQEDYNHNRLNFGSWRDLIVANCASILKSHCVIPAVITVVPPWMRFRSSRDLFESKYLLNKFKESDHIEAKEDESDYYENNYKILADVTLCYNFYFPGDNERDEKLTACNLFELLYSAWYMHHELKIIHTKLNIPQHSILCFRNERPNTKRPVNTYVVGLSGERDTFVFDTPVVSCEIFNFKSCLVMTSSPLANQEKVSFDNSQLYYLINLIQEHLEADISPDDIKTSLRSKDYWYDIFNVIAVIDYIDICTFISGRCDSPVKDLCKKITDLCTEYLDHGLNCIVRDLTRPERTFHTIWNEIRDVMQDFHFSAWTPHTLEKTQIHRRFLYDELFNLYPKKDYKLM